MQERLSAALLVILAAMLLVGWSAAARASTERVPLTPCVATVGAPEGPQTCGGRQTGLPGSEFLVTMRVPRSLPDGPLLLRWSSTWQDRADFRFRYADGATLSAGFSSAPAGDYLGLGALHGLPVPEHQAPLVAIEARISGAANVRGVMLAPELVTPARWQARQSGLIAIYSGFAGLALALLVYNLMIWRVMRLDYQLAYCLMVAATVAYALTSSGAIALILPAIDNNDRLRLNYLFLTLVGSAAVLFLRTFLEQRIFTLPLKRLYLVAQVQLILAGFAFAQFAPTAIKFLDRLYFLSFVAPALVCVITCVRAAREQSAFLRLYLFSWSVPIALYVARTLHGFGLIPYNFWLDNSTILAMSVEALLSSVIIAVRIQQMRSDRDVARALEAEARRLADTDGLTGLLNRRALIRRACEPGAGPMRLVLIDIDHFKRINDTAGHDTGDEVLREVAAVIAGALRPGAVAARIGGEEFAILFLHHRPERRHYSGLLRLIRNARPAGVAVTVSIGVADGMLGSEEAWRDLYRRADAALYRAKHAGRDRLMIDPALPASYVA